MTQELSNTAFLTSLMHCLQAAALVEHESVQAASQPVDRPAGMAFADLQVLRDKLKS